VGQDTWAAIAQELVPTGPATKPGDHEEPGPEIEVGQTTAGRETLAAINDELLQVVAPQVRPAASQEHHSPPPEAEPGTNHTPDTDSESSPTTSVPPPRARMRTRGFSEPAPAADPPPGAPPPGSASAPLQRRPARASLEAIERGLSGWASSGKPPAPPERSEQGKATYEIFEMVTFVVRGDLARFSSSSARRRFVAERLLHRLPVNTIEEIDRVDVTPWTVHATVVVRVWCRVPPG
jgi:hypothetical protein